MRWIIRHAVFVLCLSLGTSAWYILAQKKSTHAPATHATEETPVNKLNPQIDSNGQMVSPSQSFRFGPIEPMSGAANRKTVILRESPDANAPIVATLQMADYDPADILGATRDYLHVRFAANETAERKHVYEGWTTWGSVVPDLSAIILDAETGEVVSRVPLDEGMTSATFSPDGSRAIFFGGSMLAYQIRTSDYTLERSLTSPAYFSTLFYGPDGGALFATLIPNGGSYTGVNLVRIAEDGSTSIPAEFETANTLFIVVSPDGLLAFRARVESGGEAGLKDVIELSTLKVRNSFKLDPTSWPSDENSFILSRDGSELYVRLSDNNGTILVVDTRTGQFVRELPDSSTQGFSYFSQRDLLGDSILLSVWEAGDDEMRVDPQKFWISNGRRMLAQPGIDHAVDAAGKRYAVNDEGTLLFGLDDNNRIQTRRAIDRPERRKGAAMGNDLTVFGLTASPDGKRLILFLGVEHGC